jgi:hypothetical protein
MSKSQPVTQTTTQQNSIPGWLTAGSQQALQQGKNLPQYTPFTGAGPAGSSPDQVTAYLNALQTMGQGQGILQSGVGAAQGLTGFAPQQITAGNLGQSTQQLMDPYIQSVIDASNAQIDRSTNQAVNTGDQALAAQHAFGGDRQALADATTRGLAEQQKATTAANLYSGGYGSALQAALAAAQANQNAGIQGAGVQLGGVNALAGLGQGLGGLNAQQLQNLLSAGGTQQQIQNAQNMFGYQQFLNQYQIPDTQAQTFASILGALPHSTSQTGTTTGNVYTNGLLGALGLGTSIAGLGLPGTAAGVSGGTLGGAGLSALFGLMSDRRLKEDIEAVGALFDGTPVYRYRMKGQPAFQIGLMADEVTPEAVAENAEGFKMVDYKVATRLAASMGGCGPIRPKGMGTD